MDTDAFLLVSVLMDSQRSEQWKPLVDMRNSTMVVGKV